MPCVVVDPPPPPFVGGARGSIVLTVLTLTLVGTRLFKSDTSGQLCGYGVHDSCLLHCAP